MTIKEINEYLDYVYCRMYNGYSKEALLRDMNSKICGFPEEVSESLIEKGFTRVPASIKYHGNYTGGLFEHSFLVAHELCELTEKLDLTWEEEKSPFFVGMYHDVCKIDAYICKEEQSKKLGVCDVLSWDYSTFKSPYPGHGVKSILVLEDLGFILTREERLCILHHMGAYEKDMWEEYGTAIEETDNVLWTHTADMIASKILGV